MRALAYVGPFLAAWYWTLVRFGPCIGTVIAVLTAAVLGWLGGRVLTAVARRGRTRGRTAGVITAGALAGLAIGWGLSREPSARSVFQRLLHHELPESVTDARACVRWAFADPAYVVRFRADDRTVAQLVSALTLVAETGYPKRIAWPGGMGGAPQWWRTEELTACASDEPVDHLAGAVLGPRSYKTWTSRSGGGPLIDLFYCASSGVVYVVIVYT
jgi:hypothetical protein